MKINQELVVGRVQKQLYSFNFFRRIFLSIFSTANSFAGTNKYTSEIHNFILFFIYVGAYEYIIKKTHNINIDVSRLFIYYNGRVKNTHSTTVTDSGCSMTNAIEALEEFGTCLESVCPYDISRVNERPSDEAFEKGSQHKIKQALQVKIDLNEMKSCLAQGFPFAFGLRLYTSFDQAAKTGIVSMPDETEQSRSEHGRSDKIK